MAKKETYYRIDFITPSDDWEYAICRDWSEVKDYIETSEGLLYTDESTIKIQRFKMTEIQFEKYIKRLEKTA